MALSTDGPAWAARAMPTPHPLGAPGHGLGLAVARDGLAFDVIDDLGDACSMVVGRELAPAWEQIEFQLDFLLAA